jgi:uncharacterized membrane protein
MHPMVIHFPIALLLVACFCEALHLILRRDFFHRAAELNLGLAILGTVVAVALGWVLAANTHDIPMDQRYLVTWHRWLGISALVISIVAFVALHMSRLHHRVWIWLYWGLLLVAGLLIGLTGHIGGELVYGVDYFQ